MGLLSSLLHGQKRKRNKKGECRLAPHPPLSPHSPKSRFPAFCTLISYKDEYGVLLCLFVVCEELFNELCLNESVDVKSAFACQRLISQKLADAEVLVFVQILQ